MDLRKYIKKSINTGNVLNHEYMYCSHSRMQYGRPHLSILIEKNAGNAFSPDYKLQLILNESGIIIEIHRLKVIFGAGYLVKKFPAAVETKAELILNDIILPLTSKDMCDLSMLHDIQKNQL